MIESPPGPRCRSDSPPLAGLLLAAAGAGGWRWWTDLRFVETTDNVYLRGDLSTVSPKVAGYVAAVPVADNQPVRRGEVLVRLEDRDLSARVAEAAARLDARAAAILGLASELKVQGTRIREAEAGLSSARAQLARAEADLERYARLAERRNASAQQLGVARAEAERDRALVAAAEAGLEAARDQLPVLDARRAAAEAERGVAAAAAAAAAALELARLDLENGVLRAPADGIVGNRSVQVGDYVKVGARLMTVVPVDGLHVEANFKETQLGGLRVGAPVRLEADAYPGSVIEGTVASLAPASGSTFSLLPAENATGNFTKIVQRVPVRIELPREHPLRGLLRPGLSVVVTADARAPVPGGGWETDTAHASARSAAAAVAPAPAAGSPAPPPAFRAP